MATLLSTLVSSKIAESVQTTQYVSTSKITIIDKFTATNISNIIAILSVHLVPPGDIASDNNLVLNEISIPPGHTYLLPEVVGHVLEVNGFISTIVNIASALVIRVSGREIT